MEDETRVATVRSEVFAEDDDELRGEGREEEVWKEKVSFEFELVAAEKKR